MRFLAATSSLFLIATLGACGSSTDGSRSGGTAGGGGKNSPAVPAGVSGDATDCRYNTDDSTLHCSYWINNQGATTATVVPHLHLGTLDVPTGRDKVSVSPGDRLILDATMYLSPRDWSHHANDGVTLTMS